jgi:xylulokinase
LISATDAEIDALAAGSEPGARGVTFIPALTGAMAPVWEPDLRGCFYGLAASTDRGDLARAVLEGCAFAMNDVARRLVALAVPLERVALLGGGSRSAVAAQIRADASGVPVAPASEPDTCPIGAAALAAVAGGGFADLESAAADLARRDDPFEPDPAAAGCYANAYRRYLDLFESLAALNRS